MGSATSTTAFQYDDSKGMGPGTNLLTDTDGAGNSRVDYIYLNGTPIGTYQQSNNKFYFISTDRLGTPSAVTDSSQALQWTATYQPFGNTTTGASGIVQNLRLPGQEWDLESTLNHNGFRDYAATLTRFVQTDPIGLAGGMNTFQYAKGNAFKFVDRNGLAGKPPNTTVSTDIPEPYIYEPDTAHSDTTADLLNSIFSGQTPDQSLLDDIGAGDDSLARAIAAVLDLLSGPSRSCPTAYEKGYVNKPVPK